MLNRGDAARALALFGMFGCVVTSVLLPLGLGTLAPYVIEDLNISVLRFGFLASSYFLGAALISVWAGRVVRRMDGRSGLVLFLGAQILTLALMATVARRFPLLLLLSFVNGIGAAGVTPAVNKQISSLATSRGLVVGIGQSGIPAAAFLGGTVLAPLAARFGWRGAVGAGAAAGVVFLLLVLVGSAHPRDARAEEGKPNGVQRRPPLSLRRLVAFTLLMAIGQSPFYLYGVLYMSRSLGYSSVDAAQVFGVAGLIGIAARIAWGWSADRTANLLLPLRIVVGGSALAIVFLIVATPEVRWLAAIGAGLGSVFLVWIVLVNVIVVRPTDALQSPVATGAVYAAFFAGMLIAPSLFGLIIDTWGSYRAAWGTSVAFMFAGLILVARGGAEPTMDARVLPSKAPSSDAAVAANANTDVVRRLTPRR